MFALALTSSEGETHYWSGGQQWGVWPEVAVRFPDETLADQTLDMFRAAWPNLAPSARVVPLPETNDA